MAGTIAKLLPLSFRLFFYRLIVRLLVMVCGLKRRDSHEVTWSQTVYLAGFLGEGFGIGRAGDLTALGLKAKALVIKPLVLRPLIRRALKADLSLSDQDARVVIIHANAPEALLALLAYRKEDIEARALIAYWAWETPILPPFWLWAAQFFNQIWVPSTYVLEACFAQCDHAKRTDLKARFRLMPHPVALAYPQALPKLTSATSLNALCLFDLDSALERKNPFATVRAWLLAFPEPYAGVQLTLKLNGAHQKARAYADLGRLIARRPDIVLFSQKLAADEFDEFIQGFNLVISLHRSEGFGLSLAEAQCLGVGVMATKATGTADFIDDETAWEVSSRLTPISDPFGAYDGLRAQFWHDPDEVEAAEVLKKLAADPALITTKAQSAFDRQQNLTQDFLTGVADQQP